jgi:hypothetical protein
MGGGATLAGVVASVGDVAVGGTLFRAMSEAGGMTGGIRTEGVESGASAGCWTSGGVSAFRTSRTVA